MLHNSRKIIIIAGPTASGKSALALRFAQERNGVVINADAMQLYRELRILTARPTAEEEAQTPHRLYGVLPAAEASSAGKWLTLAKAEIEQAWAEGRLPIVTGGTGLYLKTLMHGIAEIPPVPDAVRGHVRLRMEVKGASAMHTELAQCDPALAEKLKPGDAQRISRGLEVFEATGKPLSEWQREPGAPPFPEDVFEKIVVEVPRTELYRRCDARFLSMMEQGALEEVKALLALGLNSTVPAMRAVGIKELAGYLNDKWPKVEAVARAQQATRNYAKRQLTWLKHQP